MNKRTFQEYEYALGNRSKKLEEVVMGWGSLRGGLYLWRYDLLIGLLRALADRSLMIADVGSGDGYLCSRLSKRYQVVGVEFASSKVRIARERSSNPHYVVADVETLPFNSSSIDIAFCIEVMEHVPEPMRLLSEIFRTLKPGGLLILTTPSLHMKNFGHGIMSPLKSLVSLYNPKILREASGFSAPDQEGRRVLDRAFSIQQAGALLMKTGFLHVKVSTILFVPIVAALVGTRVLPTEQRLWSKIPMIRQTGITAMAIGRKPDH